MRKKGLPSEAGWVQVVYHMQLANSPRSLLASAEGWPRSRSCFPWDFDEWIQRHNLPLPSALAPYLQVCTS